MMKKMSYLLRTLQIVSLIAICTIIIYQFSTLKRTANEIKYQQTQKFAASLTNIAATEATRYLVQEKDHDLQLLIENLGLDAMVRDATVYDDLGQILYQSKNVLPLANILKINNDALSIDGVVPYIAELYDKQEKIGYIRITLEQKKILSLIQDYQEKGMETLILLLILSFIAGTILMALFFRRLETAYYYVAKALCLFFLKIKSLMGI